MLPKDYEQLLEESYEERTARRLAALDRETGSIELPAPTLQSEPFPRGRLKPLRPAPHAHAGPVDVVRGAWIAKFDPNLADIDCRFAMSDPYWDFPWGTPADALRVSWIQSDELLGAKSGLQAAQEGDLVFPMRVYPKSSDHP